MFGVMSTVAQHHHFSVGLLSLAALIVVQICNHVVLTAVASQSTGTVVLLLLLLLLLLYFVVVAVVVDAVAVARCCRCCNCSCSCSCDNDASCMTHKRPLLLEVSMIVVLTYGGAVAGLYWLWA